LGGYSLPLPDGAFFELEESSRMSGSENSGVVFDAGFACPDGGLCYSVGFVLASAGGEFVAVGDFVLNGSPVENEGWIAFGDWFFARDGVAALRLDCRDRDLSPSADAGVDSFVFPVSDGSQTRYVCRNTISQEQFEVLTAEGAEGGGVLRFVERVGESSAESFAVAAQRNRQGFGSYDTPLPAGASFSLVPVRFSVSNPSRGEIGWNRFLHCFVVYPTVPISLISFPILFQDFQYVPYFPFECVRVSVVVSSQNGNHSVALRYSQFNDRTTSGFWSFELPGVSAVRLDCADQDLERDDEAENDSYSRSIALQNLLGNDIPGLTRTDYVCRNAITQQQYDSILSAITLPEGGFRGANANLRFVSDCQNSIIPECLPFVADMSFDLCQGTITGQVRAYRFETRSGEPSCGDGSVRGVSGLAVSYTHGVSSSQRVVSFAYDVEGDQSTNSGLFAPGYWRISGSGFSVVFACLDTDLSPSAQAGRDDVSVRLVTVSGVSRTRYRCVDQNVDVRTRRTFTAFGSSVTLTYLGAQSQPSVFAPIEVGTSITLCEERFVGPVSNPTFIYKSDVSGCSSSVGSVSNFNVLYTHGATSDQRVMFLDYDVEGDQSANPISFAPGYWRIAGSEFSIVFACLDTELNPPAQTGRDDSYINVSENRSKTSYLCIDQNIDARTRRTFAAFGSSVTLTYLGAQPQPSVFATIEVDLIGLEVTQGTQDWQGNLPLVRNRLLAVRAFFESSGISQGQEVEVSARLSAERSDGVNLIPSSIDSINYRDSVQVDSDLFDENGLGRSDSRSSLNFILPLEWTDLDENVELTLSLNFPDALEVNCQEAIEPVRSCSAIVSFQEVVTPRIVMFLPTLANLDDDGNIADTFTASYDNAVDQFNRIRAMMPFPTSLQSGDLWFPDDFWIINNPIRLSEEITTEEMLRSVNNQLLNFRLHNDDWGAIYLAVLHGKYTERGGVVGLAANEEHEVGAVASWFDWEIRPGTGRIEGLFGKLRNAGSHELGHTLGLVHPGMRIDEDSDELTTVCGEKLYNDRGDAYPYFADPYPENDNDPYIEGIRDGDIDDDFKDDEIVALLGPLGDVDEEVWGLDILRLQGIMESSNSWSSQYDSLLASDPRNVYSVMSDCRGRQLRFQDPIVAFPDNFDNFQDLGITQSQWLGAPSHRYIIENSEDILEDIRAFKEGASGSSEQNTDSFSGSLVFSSSTSSEVIEVELHRTYSRPREDRKVVPGDYVLELRNNSGMSLREIPFAAVKPTAAVVDGANPEFDRADFGFLVHNPPDYASFAIKQGNEELIVVQRSANTPTVSLSGVSVNQFFANGDTINLSWVGADADSDSLTYKLFYSTDGGSSYRPFLLETTSTNQVIKANQLLGSNAARFGISVSDGTRSSFSESPVFRVAEHAPQIRIQTPSENKVFAEAQGFVLAAEGYDKEDGLLGHSAFSWRSSINGALGNGSFILLSADRLTPGNHTITVTGTDTSGLTATASVNIVIARTNTIPDAVDDNVVVQLDTPMFIDVLGNDIDIEEDIYNESFKINRLPALGEAEITVSPVTGNLVVRYVGHTSGRDSLTYQICDGIDRCNTATVSVAVGLASCTIFGTEGDDMLSGTSGDDVICGLGGDDIIDGKTGNDTLLGGSGDDTIYGRLGNDTIRGGLGDDFILGHRGDDTLRGNSGTDTIFGGEGTDTIIGALPGEIVRDQS